MVQIKSFGMYYGALAMILRILDWNVSKIAMLKVLTVPHS